MRQMKVQVNLSDEMVTRVDNLAKSYGVSRSALCSMYIGQMVDSMEKSSSAVASILGNEEFMQLIANINK